MDFDVPIRTTVHVVISLVAIASGAVVACGFVTAKRLDLWTAVFLATTVLTSVTGFIFFPIDRFTPAIGVGIISLIVLAVAILGAVPRPPCGTVAGGLRYLVGRRVLLQRLRPRRPVVR
jgi:hypothetical protein